MTLLPELLRRNVAFAASRPVTAAQMPGDLAYVVCCLDPRVEPGALLGVGLNDAIVARNPGGRVTDELIADVSLISFMGEFMGLAVSGSLEVAVVHHSQCGMGLLAVPEFASAYAARAGVTEEQVAARAVTDPEATVRADVERLLAATTLSPAVRVSGHVLDLDTGLIRTVVAARPGLQVTA